MNTMNSRKRT